jgi:hypothetical protein
MKIYPVGAELFHADGQTHEQTDSQTGHSQQMLFAILLMRLKTDKCK